MAQGTFTRTWMACRDCGVAQALPGPGAVEIARAELEQAIVAFCDAHAGHVLTTVRAKEEEPPLADRPLWHPMARVSYSVTDGQRDYVLTARRQSLDEERIYEIREGRLPEIRFAVEVSSSEVASALRAAFGSSVAPALLAELVKAVHELAREIEPRSLETAFDDAEDPSIQYADWPESYRGALLATGERILPRSLHDAWRHFVHEQALAHKALALKRVAYRQHLAVERSLSAPL